MRIYPHSDGKCGHAFSNSQAAFQSGGFSVWRLFIRGLDICPQRAAGPMSCRQKLVLQVGHWYYQLWHVFVAQGGEDKITREEYLLNRHSRMYGLSRSVVFKEFWAI